MANVRESPQLPAPGPTSPLTSERLEAAITQIDARLADDGGAHELYFDRGQFLEMLGRKDEAVDAYVNLLRHAPTNANALNALGLLTLATGNRPAARTFLRGAILHGPFNAAAHANLAYISVLDEQFTTARALYEEALRLDPELAIAHHGLADLLPRFGDDAGAEEHRLLGLRHRPVTIGRFVGEGRPIHILGLGTSSTGNVPTYGYFDDRVFLLSSLIVDHVDPDLPLPPHEIVFNAIGEADLCATQLARAGAIVARTTAPVINDPGAVAATSRAANAQRLRRLADVVTPRIVSFTRTELVASGGDALLSTHGFAYPLLVRSPGYHTGDHFVRVERRADLADSIAALPGDELLVIEYLDLCDAAKHFRKYRVIIVDGKLYPLHLAISRGWKVHYFSADMADRADHRAEDAAFLNDMQGVLGARAIDALERVREMLALDYGGIDFAIARSGDVVVFEANASMIVPTPERDAIWDYRRGPVNHIRSAVRAMLMSRATKPRAASITAENAA